MLQEELQKLIQDTFHSHVPEAKQQPAYQHEITVELAVQHKWGGNRFTFAHTVRTISYFEAQLAARRAAEKLEYVVWWVLDRYEGKPLIS